MKTRTVDDDERLGRDRDRRAAYASSRCWAARDRRVR